MSMIVDRRNLDFLLYDVLGAERLFAHPMFAAYDRAAATAVLDAAQSLAEEVFLPFAAKLDANEPEFRDGEAIVIPEVKHALAAFAEAGYFAAGFSERWGGLQMPSVLQTTVMGLFTCANLGATGYAFLTVAAANLLEAFGSEDQKRRYLPPMLAGRWFGTMALSEPQAGSSLADIRCKAEPVGDGLYRISGSKMWISGGEQNISENIAHMALAKIPGGPPGVKGISLFITPKHRVGPDGALGPRNGIALAGLNHKMGHRGTTNTLLNFSEGGDTLGELVGEPHHGLAYMFHMMNEARIGVGQGAVMCGVAGYRYSLKYARERLQGRRLSDKDPTSPPVPLIAHPDVRRMLLAQRAFVEGGLALVTYCALLLDLSRVAERAEEKRALEQRLDLLTPIAKSWPSEYCLEANKLAIQVLGGYGYTRDYPVERFYRDNRLNPIHEGAHGIHGLDLLGRKARMGEGAALRSLLDDVRATIAAARDGFPEEAQTLESALAALVTATQAALSEPDPERGLANATLYLDAFGHVVVGWLWLQQALAAAALSPASEDEAAFRQGKLIAARFFFRHELPKALVGFRLVATLDDSALQATPETFS